jgi:hypothetical protein
MSKFDAAIPSAYTTAGTLAVTTKDALLHGVCIVAGATATAGSVVIANSAGSVVFGISAVTSGGIANDGPYQPVVCAGGISATCAGTAFNYIVYYSLLHV